MPPDDNPTDVAVGSRIRMRRIELRLSQKNVADELKVSFQQIQKYEKGRNRVAASRLVALSRLLKVSPEYFFAEPEERRAVAEAGTVIGVVASVTSEDGLRLNQAFRRIVDVELRARIIALIEAVARESE